MTMIAPSRISLNTMTVDKQWTLRECIEACTRHGFGGISPWRHKLAECGVDEAARMIADHGLTVTGLCRGGMFTAADDAEFQAKVDDNRQAIDDAAAIGAVCLVLVVGGLPDGSKRLDLARSQVMDGIAKVLDHARAAGVPLAIEPLHPMYAGERACVNTIGQGLAMCDQLGDGIGLAVDVYHVWWDPDLEAGIARAGEQGRILAYHLCDWLVPTTHMLLDRGMMGDGVIDLDTISRQVRATGFDGLNEVEIMSAENWWKRPGDEVMEVIAERCAAIPDSAH